MGLNKSQPVTIGCYTSACLVAVVLTTTVSSQDPEELGPWRSLRAVLERVRLGLVESGKGERKRWVISVIFQMSAWKKLEVESRIHHTSMV